MEYVFRDLVSNTGRIKNSLLISFINSASKEKFRSVITHPMLVSLRLYEGRLSKPLGNSRATMVFNAEVLCRHMEETHSDSTPLLNTEENFNSAIFALKKNRDSTTPTHSFSIGRMIPNDIIIADYTMSKNHATITLHQGNYYIYDLQSTNGTKVAGTRLQANQPQQLKAGDSIAFGRLGYIFLTAESIYEFLKK